MNYGGFQATVQTSDLEERQNQMCLLLHLYSIIKAVKIDRYFADILLGRNRESKRSGDILNMQKRS